jgi:hypothetical protein
MGRAISTKTTQPAGRFRHDASGTEFVVTQEADGMHQRLSRDGFSADYKVAYAIGSGHKAFGYLIQLGDYLYQSPITYDTERKTWGIAPGYEQNTTPDFNRAVAPECLLCHAAYPQFVPGTRNRYRTPIVSEEGISCGRCHGDGIVHAAQPSRSNIINPSRLPAGERDSICEQCHLQGQIRILNPGKDWNDFKPGELLEKTFTVFTGNSADDIPLRVISQSEQLRRSSCWKNSATKLWCGSCHDPHREPANRATHYRERCLNCHAATLAANHRLPGADCAGCHMQTRGTADGAHSAFTDHQIRRRPVTDSPPPKLATLSAWRPSPPEYAQRNLGLAYLNVGTQEQLPEFLRSALTPVVESHKAAPSDPDLTAGRGLLMFLHGMSAQAAGMFERAAGLRPSDATFPEAAADAWLNAGQPQKAIELLERVLEKDPYEEIAYVMLANLHQGQNDREKERAIVARYLALRPQSMDFRVRLRAARP